MVKFKSEILYPTPPNCTWCRYDARPAQILVTRIGRKEGTGVRTTVCHTCYDEFVKAWEGEADIDDRTLEDDEDPFHP